MIDSTNARVAGMPSTGAGQACASAAASATAVATAVASAVARAFSAATNGCAEALAEAQASAFETKIVTATASASASACSTGMCGQGQDRWLPFIVEAAGRADQTGGSYASLYPIPLEVVIRLQNE